MELIRHLAEDDKEGVMAEKVLNLFWNLAHANDVAIDIMDQALSAHIKILDYSCTQYRETQKTRWLTKCIDELKTNSTWVLPALKVNKAYFGINHYSLVRKFQETYTFINFCSKFAKYVVYTKKHPTIQLQDLKGPKERLLCIVTK